MFHLRPGTDTQNNKSDGALDLHLPVLLLEDRCERRAGRLAVEYFLHVGAVWVLKEARAVFGKEFPSGGQRLECEFVLDE